MMKKLLLATSALVLAASAAHAYPGNRIRFARASSSPPPSTQMLVSGQVPSSSWAYMTQPADAGAGAGSTDDAIGDFDSPPFQTISTPWTFGVVAGHSPTNGEFNAGKHNNVDHVTCSMDGGPDATVTTPTANPVMGEVSYLYGIDPTDPANLDGSHEIRCGIYLTTGRALLLQGQSRSHYQAVGQFFADATHPYVNITTAPVGGSAAAIKAGLRLDYPGVVPANMMTTAANGASSLCGGGNCSGSGGTGTYPTNISINLGGTFTGSVSGTTLTITGVTTGGLAPGVTLSGTGIASNSAVVSQGSGTPGGAGTYTLDKSSAATGSITITGSVFLAIGAERSFFVFTNGHGGLPATKTRVASGTGTNSPTCGDEGVTTDCLTIEAAIDSLSTAMGGDPSGGQVLLKGGSYEYGDASGASHENSRYVTITHHPSVTAADVVITGRHPGGTQGLRTSRVHLKDVFVSTTGDPINGSITSSVNPIGTTLAVLWADNINYSATSYSLSGTFVVGHYGGIYVTGGDFSNSAQAVQDCELFANATIHNVGFVAQGCQTHIGLTVNPEVETYVYGGRSNPYIAHFTLDDSCLTLTRGGNPATPAAPDFYVGGNIGIASGDGSYMKDSASPTHAVATTQIASFGCNGANSLKLGLAPLSPNGQVVASLSVDSGTSSTNWLTATNHTDIWITARTIHKNVIFYNINMPSALGSVGILTSGTNFGGIHDILILNSHYNPGQLFSFSDVDNFAIIDTELKGSHVYGPGPYTSFTVTGGSCDIAMPAATGLTKQGASGC